eukprot:CAMPEP_0185206856 /NCGR_PEP_ID=MMETSP1140-20130426/59195_1 /TAXON_ID=298111 /ORGANISM="Pavlova sp., Strain CCMP459" /LENGTH=188 /DNA_ID=CAMNT_0027774515 /DNA_START=216 /DNA_END=780 /DNA_ORIENTATION=-
MPSTPTSASQFFSYTSPRDGGSPGHFSVLRRRAHTLSILHSGSHGPSSPIKPSLMSESLAHHASYHICGRDTSSSPLMRTSSALSQWSPHGRTTSPSPQSPVITTLHSSPAQEEHPAHNPGCPPSVLIPVERARKRSLTLTASVHVYRLLSDQRPTVRVHPQRRTGRRLAAPAARQPHVDSLGRGSVP